MSTLHPGVWLKCVGPTGPGSTLVMGARYQCLAVDQEPEHCRVHPDRGCGGVMVAGACPASGFWFCERLFKPIDDQDEDLFAAIRERALA